MPRELTSGASVPSTNKAEILAALNNVAAEYRVDPAAIAAVIDMARFDRSRCASSCRQSGGGPTYDCHRQEADSRPCTAVTFSLTLVPVSDTMMVTNLARLQDGCRVTPAAGASAVPAGEARHFCSRAVLA